MDIILIAVINLVATASVASVFYALIQRHIASREAEFIARLHRLETQQANIGTAQAQVLSHLRSMAGQSSRPEASSHAEDGSKSASATSASHAPKLPPTELVLGDDSNPLVKIIGVDKAAPRPHFTPVPVTSTIQRQLGPAASFAAQTLKGVAEMSQRSLRMVLSPELTKGINDGTLAMMKSKEVIGGFRGNVIATEGRPLIEGQASFVQGINSTAVALGVLQILSVITAQQYLAMINSHLARIESGIADIKNWLNDEVRGKIRGNSERLRRIAQAVQRHEIGEEERRIFAQTLEDIDGECTQILKLVEEQRLRALEDFRSKTFQADGWWIGSDSLADVKEKFERELSPCQTLGELGLLATSVRAMSITLRGALGLHVGHSLDLSEELLRDHQGSMEAFARWKAELGSGVEKLKSRYRTEDAEREVRGKLRASVSNSFAGIDARGSELRGQLLALSAGLKEQLEAASRPVVLELALDAEGRIREIQHAS